MSAQEPKPPVGEGPVDPAPRPVDKAPPVDQAPGADYPAGGQDVVPFPVALRAWFGISLQTFGGPAGQIAVMHRTLVDERRWIGEKRFLHALNYCMLLPGPEAQQLAVYTGWLLNGTRGGVAAGVLFVLPGMIAMLFLAAVYVAFGTTTVVTAVFSGLAPAVLAIVAQAVLRVGRRAVTHRWLLAVAVAAFLALAVFHVAFPLVIAGAGIAGWIVGRVAPNVLAVQSRVEGATGPPPVIPDGSLRTERPSGRRTAVVLVIGLLTWVIPLATAIVLLGRGSAVAEQGQFFAGAALVTFGGAYAVLAYVAQRAVEDYGWLNPGEMASGLALAETTPGPLIMVVQFVAFLGAFRDPGGLDPWVAAVLGAVLTTWMTFVPSFLFIFLGAPYVERLRGNRSIAAALTGISAAVVGVIANLALYFALHTLFAGTDRRTAGPIHLELPELGTLRPVEVGIAVVAVVMTFGLRWSVLRTLGACAVLGLLAGLAMFALS